MGRRAVLFGRDFHKRDIDLASLYTHCGGWEMRPRIATPDTVYGSRYSIVTS